MEISVDVDPLEKNDNVIVHGEKLKEISKNEGKELKIEDQTVHIKTEIKMECRLGEMKREMSESHYKEFIGFGEDDKKEMKQEYVKQEVKEDFWTSIKTEIKEECTLGKRKLLDEDVKVEMKQEYIEEEIKELPNSLPKIEIEMKERFDLHKKAKKGTKAKKAKINGINSGFRNFQQNIWENKNNWSVMCPVCPSTKKGTSVKICKFPKHVKKMHESFVYEKMNAEDSKVTLTNVEMHIKCMESQNDKNAHLDNNNSKDIKLFHDSNMGKQIEEEPSNKNIESTSDNRFTASKSATLNQLRTNCPSSQTSKATIPDGGNELSWQPGNNRCFSGDEGSKYSDCEEEINMALVVRQDLKMGKLQTADQMCNATLAVYKLAMQKCPQALRAWEANGQPKVIAKADKEEVLLNVLAQARSVGLVCAVVTQAGCKQIAPGTKTVVALGPGPADLVDQVTRALKKF